MTLAGVWRNDYGSRMSLDVDGDLIFGTYSSTTGSTGTYGVVGRQQAVDPTSALGQAAALAIAWRSIVPGPADNSWHWSSALSGQLSLEDGRESLVLTHALVASSGFPGLCEAGTHLDKLAYRRVADRPAEPLARPDLSAPRADPVCGVWRSADGAMRLTIRVYAGPGNLFGWVRGELEMNGGLYTIDGVTDIDAGPAGLARQSIGLVALAGNGDGPAIAFAGCLDPRKGILNLLNLSSRPTAPDATYVQTTAAHQSFRRVGVGEAIAKSTAGH